MKINILKAEKYGYIIHTWLRLQTLCFKGWPFRFKIIQNELLRLRIWIRYKLFTLNFEYTCVFYTEMTCDGRHF